MEIPRWDGGQTLVPKAPPPKEKPIGLQRIDKVEKTLSPQERAAQQTKQARAEIESEALDKQKAAEAQRVATEQRLVGVRQMESIALSTSPEEFAEVIAGMDVRKLDAASARLYKMKFDQFIPPGTKKVRYRRNKMRWFKPFSQKEMGVTSPSVGSNLVYPAIRFSKKLLKLIRQENNYEYVHHLRNAV